MILLDTCGLIWWTLDPSKLSKKAATEMNEPEEVLVSSISIWEVGIKVKNKKLDIGMTMDEYYYRLKQVSTLKILSVNVEIWISSLNLNWKHRDPADRVIVATAKEHTASIITTDKEMKKYYKKIIW